MITDLLSTFRALAGASTIGATIMRVHVTLNAFVAAGTGTGTTHWRVGLLVAPLLVEAVDIPPINAPDLDWMWNSRHTVGNAAITLPHGEQTHIDCKAKRRIEEVGSTLWLAQDPELGGATSLSANFWCRVLLALP